MKKKSIALVILLTCAMGITGCDSINLNAFNKQEAEEEEDKRVTVKYEVPSVSSIAIDNDFIGMVESEEQVYVVSKLSGDVTDTFFEVGDYVNQGDLLFTIDDTAAQISYKQAQATLSSANASLNTAKAGVNTANANVNYQTASVTESFAKSSTTDEQLALAIKQAEVNFANAEINIGTLEDSLAKINDSINQLDDSYSGAKKLLAKQASTGFPDNEATEAAKRLIASYDSTKESLESNKKQVESSLRTAKNSTSLIVDQANIARDQLSDYDNYTKATIGNGGLASLASAQAGVVQAEAGVVQSKAGITQAQAAVEAAQLQLDYANVTAPVSGIITSKGVTKNNMTSAGSVAYSIMSSGSSYVSFNVSEKVMSAISEGQTVSVDKDGEIYEAVITENPGVVDQQSGLFKVKAKINGVEGLTNGVMVKIIMTTQHADNVMTVPIDAVYHESEKSYVYVYNNGIANKVYVETGLYDDNVIEIVSGLAVDDTVITTWSSQLRNGVEVKVDNSVSKDNSQSGGIVIERD